jgi:hypothetical protein
LVATVLAASYVLSLSSAEAGDQPSQNAVQQAQDACIQAPSSTKCKEQRLKVCVSPGFSKYGDTPGWSSFCNGSSQS